MEQPTTQNHLAELLVDVLRQLREAKLERAQYRTMLNACLDALRDLNKTLDAERVRNERLVIRRRSERLERVRQRHNDRALSARSAA